jgi:hypothetical protein
LFGSHQTQASSLHLEIQRHRGNPVGIIRSSFRENGKVKHTTHGRITGLTLEQLKLLQAAFRGDVVPKGSAEKRFVKRLNGRPEGTCERFNTHLDDIFAHWTNLANSPSWQGLKTLRNKVIALTISWILISVSSSTLQPGHHRNQRRTTAAGRQALNRAKPCVLPVLSARSGVGLARLRGFGAQKIIFAT